MSIELTADLLVAASQYARNFSLSPEFDQSLEPVEMAGRTIKAAFTNIGIPPEQLDRSIRHAAQLVTSHATERLEDRFERMALFAKAVANGLTGSQVSEDVIAATITHALEAKTGAALLDREDLAHLYTVALRHHIPAMLPLPPWMPKLE